jgi:hypothetical protein
MPSSAAVAPGSLSYVRAGSAEPPCVLLVGDRGAAPGTAADIPEELDAEATAGGGGAGEADGGVVEGAVECKVAGGRCGGAAAAEGVSGSGGAGGGTTPAAALRGAGGDGAGTPGAGEAGGRDGGVAREHAADQVPEQRGMALLSLASSERAGAGPRGGWWFAGVPSFFGGRQDGASQTCDWERPRARRGCACGFSRVQ